MSARLYVGGLSFDTDSEGLKRMFESSGTVNSAVIATDKSSGRPKGFGFVEMASDDEAHAAIASLNGTTVDSRTLRVEVAKLPERAAEAPRS